MNGSGKQKRATNRNQNLVWKLELGVHFLSSNNPVIDFISWAFLLRALISWGSLVRILISWGSLVRALISWGSLMRALINWGSLALQVTCLMKKQGHSHRCWWPFPSNKLYSSIIDGCINSWENLSLFKTSYIPLLLTVVLYSRENLKTSSAQGEIIKVLLKSDIRFNKNAKYIICARKAMNNKC